MCLGLAKQHPLMQRGLHYEYQSKIFIKYVASLGAGGRPGYFRGVFWLELWLGNRRNHGVSGHDDSDRHHLTLVVLAIGVMIFAGGAGDWKALSNINDPLPQAMKMIVGDNSTWLHMLVWIGLFGLIASFHGIILGYSRQIFALSRAGYMPTYFGAVNTKFQTPHRAIIAGALVGIAAILSDDLQFNGMTLTANLITMAVFGAIVMYIVSMLSLFALRKNEPNLERPFKSVAYPLFPAIALMLASISLVTMIYFNFKLSLIFFGLMAAAYVYFSMTQHHRDASLDNVIVTTA